MPDWGASHLGASFLPAPGPITAKPTAARQCPQAVQVTRVIRLAFR